MYKNFVSSLYVLNIVFQCIFSLATPIGLTVLISWLLVRYAGAPGWIYAPIVIVGVITGLISMVKFAISASEALERLEKQNSKNKKH